MTSPAVKTPRYVQRCKGNYCEAKVKGVTSFGRLPGGGRKPVCLFCERAEQEENSARCFRTVAEQAAITRLRQQIGGHESTLKQLRKKLERLEERFPISGTIPNTRKSA